MNGVPEYALRYGERIWLYQTSVNPSKGVYKDPIRLLPIILKPISYKYAGILFRINVTVPGSPTLFEVYELEMDAVNCPGTILTEWGT